MIDNLKKSLKIMKCLGKKSSKFEYKTGGKGNFCLQPKRGKDIFNLNTAIKNNTKQ